MGTTQECLGGADGTITEGGNRFPAAAAQVGLVVDEQWCSVLSRKFHSVDPGNAEHAIIDGRVLGQKLHW